MNILQELSKLKKKHSYFYAEQQSNELPFSLEIDLNDTLHQAQYDETYQPLTNIHIGQRKLLLSEIQLMNEYYKTYAPTSTKTPLMLYIGSAPGIHLTYLSTMFPKLKFVLYDGATFDNSLQNNNLFELHQGQDGFFTTEKAVELKDKYNNYDLLFVCDIRLDSDNITEFEKNVMNDMSKQQDWVRILTPLLSLLKFRTPYNFTGNMTYMSGKLLYGIWRPPKSTESRLLTHQKEIGENKEYNADVYEKNHFFHNKYIRPFAFRKAFIDFSKYITQSNQYCPCYDCYAELTVLKEYETIIQQTGTKYQNIDDVINVLNNNSKFNTLYNNKFWSKTWDDNIPIEKELEQLESEPNSIIGIKRNIPIENKNVLIVIPKVNIYNIENFESVFTEYIDDFNKNISKISFDNMMYYTVIILEQQLFKEKIHYGALMNSAYTIATFSENKYERILFHEPFVMPNTKLFELYLKDTISENIIIYSSIYEPLHKLSVFSIKTDIFYNINGYPNNIDDVLMCNNICLDRIMASGIKMEHVHSNEIDSNSVYFNITYEDYIDDGRPTKLSGILTGDEIEIIKNIRNKSNYDNWCGVKQKFYFNTQNIINYINNIGEITNILKYTISLHNSCDVYNNITYELQELTRLEDINREIINFIKQRIEKYLINEKFTVLEDNTIKLEHTTNQNYTGLYINYGEYLECILNIIEETYYFINNIKIENETINSVLKMMINKWYSYINVYMDDKDIRIYIIKLSEPFKLVENAVNYTGLMKLNKLYMYSQYELDKYLIRTLLYDTVTDYKLLYEYQKLTYMKMIVHNVNILTIDKMIEEFEQNIN
jgi:hypothetical protein